MISAKNMTEQNKNLLFIMLLNAKEM